MPSVTRTRFASLFATLRAPGLSRFEWGCLAAMAVGLSVRLAAFAVTGVESDAGAYMSMAVSLLRNGEFIEPGVGAYTQHFPPVFPALVAASYAVFGVSYGAAHLVSVLGAVLLVAVAFFTTRDLFGRERAFAAAALTAVFPVLVPFDLHLLSESYVAAFFTLTIWAILKSLKEPKFVVWAGVFAALSYLTKASMGYFVVLAGLGGLSWRFAFMRWRVFTDKYYLAAASIVVATVVAWAARNLARHGWPHWETQRHASESFRIMFATPGWPAVLAQEILWSAFLVLVFALPVLWGVRRSLRRWREEETSGLLMAVVTPTFVAVFFVTAFFITEKMDAVVNTLNKRYLVTPLVPILWLGLREMDLRRAERPAGRPESGERRRRVGVALAVAGVATLALAFALDPTQERLTIGRVLALFALVAVGGALLAAAPLFATRVATRAVGTGRERAETWRWVPEEGGARRAAAALGLVAAGLAVAFFWALSLLPLFGAGAAVAALGPRRAGVAAAIAVLAGGALAGSYVMANEPSAMADLNAAAPDGAVVQTYRHDERFLYPFLDARLRLERHPDAPADYVVDHLPPQRNPEPPEGYALWKSYPYTMVRLPGTLAERAIERALGVEPPSASDRPAIFVYARTAATA